jgi:hypothetical protein
MIKIRSGSAKVARIDVTRALDLRDATVVVGLVNNMPDAALQATERQFCDLLAEASQDFLVWVRFFSIPNVRRAEHTSAVTTRTLANCWRTVSTV